MSRRKMKKIELAELKCGSLVMEELESMPELSGFDSGTAILIIKGKSPAPLIRDIGKAIKNLERYEAVNKHLITTYAGQQIIHKKQLARMLGISRPTLDKWIENGFISPVPLKCIHGETFPIREILNQLRLHESKKH